MLAQGSQRNQRGPTNRAAIGNQQVVRHLLICNDAASCHLLVNDVTQHVVVGLFSCSMAGLNSWHCFCFIGEGGGTGQPEPEGLGGAEVADEHDLVDTTQVTENGITVDIPTPHIFEFSLHPIKKTPRLRYKILSTDTKWLPAKKDAKGDVIWETDGQGRSHWASDEDGIELVTSWPEGGLPWGTMSESWEPSQDLSKEGNSLRPVMMSVDRCEGLPPEYDWLPSHSKFYNDWMQSWKEVETFADVAKKHQYHQDFDPTEGRLPDFTLPKPRQPTTLETQQASTLQEQASVEPILHSRPEGRDYTRASRERQVRRMRVMHVCMAQ